MITSRCLFLCLIAVVLLLKYATEGGSDHRSELKPLIRSPVEDGQTGKGSYRHKVSLGKLDDPDVDRRYYSFSQEESGLMMVWLKYIRSSGSKRAEALEEIRMELSERAHVDGQVGMIGVLLFGSEQAHSILYSHRDIGLPVVDDFECYMSRGRFFEKHCGVLSEYGLKHALAFANICNHLVSREAFEEAVVDTCGKKIMTLEYSF